MHFDFFFSIENSTCYANRLIGKYTRFFKLISIILKHLVFVTDLIDTEHSTHEIWIHTKAWKLNSFGFPLIYQKNNKKQSAVQLAYYTHGHLK